MNATKRPAQLAIATGAVLAVTLLASSHQPPEGRGRWPDHHGRGTPAQGLDHPQHRRVRLPSLVPHLRPASIDPSKAVPLVVMLHGGFGSGEQVESAYGWDAKADAEGFVVAYPNGQDRAWNAGTCCGKPAKEHVDDVAFIVQVVQAVQRQQQIDPRRIFATGASNGA